MHAQILQQQVDAQIGATLSGWIQTGKATELTRSALSMSLPFLVLDNKMVSKHTVPNGTLNQGMPELPRLHASVPTCATFPGTTQYRVVGKKNISHTSAQGC